MSADAILDALDPDQREVALALTGPVCVLAGAGTGKTRAITHRIAYGVATGTYQPTSVLAVTFTARAAGEMRTRLRDLGVTGVQARTFHAAALRQLSYFWPQVIGGAPPRILEHKAPIVAEAARRLGLAVDRLTVRDLSSEIEWSKVSLIAPDDYVKAATATGRPAPAGYDHAAVERLIRAYEDAKDLRHVIDFEDVLMYLADMIAGNRSIAETVRSQYRRFVVDEYQDVSPLQQHLLDQWLGGRQEVCVVGDPSQTIYSFTGASPHHLLTFASRHDGAQVIRLVRDYRSTPQVVDLANRLLRTAPRQRGQGEVLELIAQRPSSRPVAFTAYDDDESEAAGVADRVARLVAAGTPVQEIAVLYRTNAQSEAFEQALADAGIGYLVRGGERFFARKEVRDAVMLLRGAARSESEGAMPETVRAVLASAGWTPEPPAARGAVRERWDALQALVALADDLAAARDATLTDLVADLEERAAAQQAPAVEGVTLASLHAAKGLEWDAVFLTGLSEGLMPISLAETKAAVAEERRLLYVGITRAREHLELSFARSRGYGGRPNRRRTRFLDGLWPDHGAGPSRRGGPGGRAGGRAAAPVDPGRAALDAEAPSRQDCAALAALQLWREEVAARQGTSTHQVVADATLAALVEARPRTIQELDRVRGIGPQKLQRYGADLLAVLAEHR